MTERDIDAMMEVRKLNGKKIGDDISGLNTSLHILFFLSCVLANIALWLSC